MIHNTRNGYRPQDAVGCDAGPSWARFAAQGSEGHRGGVKHCSDGGDWVSPWWWLVRSWVLRMVHTEKWYELTVVWKSQDEHWIVRIMLEWFIMIDIALLTLIDNYKNGSLDRWLTTYGYWKWIAKRGAPNPAWKRCHWIYCWPIAIHIIRAFKNRS